MAFENKGAMAATVVVAASDSLNKAAANYVCDGVDDDVEIQEAIDALPAGGGKIVLLDGTYRIADTLILSSYLVLDLSAATLIMENNTRLRMIANASSFDGSEPKVTDIELILGEIDGNRANQGVGDIEGLIAFSKVERLIIRDGYIHDVLGDAIRVWIGGMAGVATDPGAISIINNKIVGCYAGSSNFGKGIGVAAGCNSLIEGNHIKLTYHQAIWTGVASRVTINANTLDDSKEGIWLSYDSFEVTVSNNNISRTTQGDYGIYLLECKNTAVSGNTIYQVSRGIYIADVQHASIVGNIVELCGRSGIEADTNSGQAYVSIIGNVVGNCAKGVGWEDGIRLIYGSYYVVKGNILYDDQTTHSQSSGIYIADTVSYAIVFGNICVGSVAHPIVNACVTAEFDRKIISSKLDLSGAAQDIEAFIAVGPAELVGYTILYTEASSADAGANIRIGRYQNGVALDDDYFDISVSEVSKNQGYTKYFITTDLTHYKIASGDTVTVGTAGGKVGTGEVMIILHIAEMAS